MAYVIAEPCVATCDTACVAVCPVDAIHGPVSIPPRDLQDLTPHERVRRFPELQLYIDPDTCICCAACEPECPVNAIFHEDDLPAKWRDYRQINADAFRRLR